MFILFDLDDELIREWQNRFGELTDFKIVKSDVRKLENHIKIDYYVSPANSYGYMDGGIDETYMKMFPDIQSQVRETIHKYRIWDLNRGLFLPIGSTIKVNQILCCPTMIAPEKIYQNGIYPANVYFAFLSILFYSLTEPDKNIAIPGLGTGTGYIPPDLCAKEMFDAYNHFLEVKPRLLKALSQAKSKKNRDIREQVCELFKPQTPDTKILQYNSGGIVFDRVVCRQMKRYINELIPWIKNDLIAY